MDKRLKTSIIGKGNAIKWINVQLSGHQRNVFTSSEDVFSLHQISNKTNYTHTYTYTKLKKIILKLVRSW